MIRSMTGYGRSESVLHDRKITVELRSVNHRFCEINVRVPKILNPLENYIKTEISKTVSRGKIDVFIQFETYSPDDFAVGLNEAFADVLIVMFDKLKNKFPQLNDDLSLSFMAKFPDIITIEKSVDCEKNGGQIYEMLNIALSDAINIFLSMKETEGRSLLADIMDKRQLLISLIDKVKTRSPEFTAEYADKLRQKVVDALSGVVYDEARLIQEITVFADKSCIDEEITRVESHLIQLAEILNDEVSSGKKLDFLIQEINREVNTIGAKSNDLHITRIVVEMKSELEKIREQVQNIE